MKKFLAMLLSLVMVFSLVACGDKEDAADNKDGAQTEETASKGLTPEERAKEFITVGTGPTSGIYFPIGGAFATALKEYGYKTSAEASNATGQNIQNILNGDVEIAVAMQDAVMSAYTATNAYEGKEPATDLCALMRLWPNYVQLVTTADTGIKCVDDLRGKRVGVGAANSGVEFNARMILNAFGITYDDITPDYLAVCLQHCLPFLPEPPGKLRPGLILFQVCPADFPLQLFSDFLQGMFFHAVSPFPVFILSHGRGFFRYISLLFQVRQADIGPVLHLVLAVVIFSDIFR